MENNLTWTRNMWPLKATKIEKQLSDVLKDLKRTAMAKLNFVLRSSSLAWFVERNHRLHMLQS